MLLSATALQRDSNIWQVSFSSLYLPPLFKGKKVSKRGELWKSQGEGINKEKNKVVWLLLTREERRKRGRERKEWNVCLSGERQMKRMNVKGEERLKSPDSGFREEGKGDAKKRPKNGCIKELKWEVGMNMLINNASRNSEGYKCFQEWR